MNETLSLEDLTFRLKKAEAELLALRTLCLSLVGTLPASAALRQDWERRRLMMDSAVLQLGIEDGMDIREDDGLTTIQGAFHALDQELRRAPPKR